MPKVTSKLQLTVPKAIADQYGIRPGDELEWIPAGESIRVELVRRKAKVRTSADCRGASGVVRRRHQTRLDRATGGRTEESNRGKPASSDRGWTREDLYNDDRGLPRGFPR